MSDEKVIEVNLIVRFEQGQMGKGDHEVAAESIKRVITNAIGNGALTEWSNNEVEVDEYSLRAVPVETSGKQSPTSGD